MKYLVSLVLLLCAGCDGPVYPSDFDNYQDYLKYRYSDELPKDAENIRVKDNFVYYDIVQDGKVYSYAIRTHNNKRDELVYELSVEPLQAEKQ